MIQSSVCSISTIEISRRAEFRFGNTPTTLIRSRRMSLRCAIGFDDHRFRRCTGGKALVVRQLFALHTVNPPCMRPGELARSCSARRRRRQAGRDRAWFLREVTPKLDGPIAGGLLAVPCRDARTAPPPLAGLRRALRRRAGMRTERSPSSASQPHLPKPTTQSARPCIQGGEPPILGRKARASEKIGPVPFSLPKWRYVCLSRSFS